VNEIRLIHTTAFRLALRYTGFVCLLTIAGFTIIYWVTISQLNTQIDAGLRAESAALTRLYELKGIAGLRETVAALSTTKSLAASDTGDAGPRQYLLTDQRMLPLAGSLPRWPAGVPAQNLAWATADVWAPPDQPGLDAEHRHFKMRAWRSRCPAATTCWSASRSTNSSNCATPSWR